VDEFGNTVIKLIMTTSPNPTQPTEAEMREAEQILGYHVSPPMVRDEQLVKNIAQALHRAADRARREMAKKAIFVYKSKPWANAIKSLLSHLQSVGAVGLDESKSDI